MSEWRVWPPDWPQEERLLEGRQRCPHCDRQLQGAISRPVPGKGWMHKNCAIAEARIEYNARVFEAQFDAVRRPNLSTWTLDEDELEDEEVP